jgi:hypothetical protein
MKFTVHDCYNLPKADVNEIHLTTDLHTMVLQTHPNDWKSLCNEFRFNLQSRIVATSDDRELHKLQGKIEYVSELEKFFLEILKPE